MSQSTTALVETARALLRGLAGDIDTKKRFENLLSLLPQEADYVRVFSAEHAPMARKAYEEIWPLMALPVKAEQTELRIYAATVDQLRNHWSSVQGFPGGYQVAAEYLNPGHIWLCCEFIAPGKTDGLLMDGLVPLDSRWAWFPKPWKALKIPSRSAATLSHWGE